MIINNKKKYPLRDIKKKAFFFAFVDYLQVMQTNEKNRNQNEEQFYGVVARRLKNLCFWIVPILPVRQGFIS